MSKVATYSILAAIFFLLASVVLMTLASFLALNTKVLSVLLAACLICGILSGFLSMWSGRWNLPPKP